MMKTILFALVLGIMCASQGYAAETGLPEECEGTQNTPFLRIRNLIPGSKITEIHAAPTISFEGGSNNSNYPMWPSDQFHKNS
jgi:hypothetical protein